MPNEGRSNSHQWHSFDFGAIHVTMVSTEVWHGKDQKAIARQYKWIESDLRKASMSRAEVPFLIVVGHRPLYCSSGKKECKDVPNPVRDGPYGIEHLLYKYKVDIYFGGHLHSYERSFPVYYDDYEVHDLHRHINPNKTVHVTIGNAGNKHKVKTLKAKKTYIAFQINQYGYGRLTANSETELLWEHIDSKTRMVTDYLQIEKANNGN